MIAIYFNAGFFQLLDEMSFHQVFIESLIGLLINLESHLFISLINKRLIHIYLGSDIGAKTQPEFLLTCFYWLDFFCQL